MKNIKRVAAITIAAGGLAVAGAGVASAHSQADATALNSPGIASGNVLQVPVKVGANVCGNSATVVGLLSPNFGNTCQNN
ncbi:chaplin [Streptomyces sp. NPDC050636]|uniref:chaplin n=1 Tax=Streptomyces sp. NPDC050636 TaxID=3154510 RepID=UPI003411F933